jgi:uncharacterized protein YabE (DUF348 family)
VDNSQNPGYRKEIVKRRSGAVYVTYREYYKNGKEVKREQVARSTYRAYAGEVVVGPESSYTRPLE